MQGITLEPAGMYLQRLGFVPWAHDCKVMLPAQAAGIHLGASGQAATSLSPLQADSPQPCVYQGFPHTQPD